MAGGLAAFAAAAAALLGAEHVTPDGGLAGYGDPFPVGDPAEFAAGLAVRAGSTEDVSALVLLANEHRIELWPISQGRNNGYGGRSPRTRGAVVLDLSRMNQVLEIDEVNGTVLLEPGVRFSDLHEAVVASGAPFWTSAPDLSWGSVIGNALERGLGYTAYGEHNRMICGMEVVLPSGEVVRTGMGAMEDSRTWQLYGQGFGPAVDGLFSQSNLGIVTKLGMWLMPRPQSWAVVEVSVDEVDDLAPLVDIARPLKFDGTIPSTIVIGDPIGVAAFMGPRSEWQTDGGRLAPDVMGKMMSHFGVGRWTMTFALYGHTEVLQAQLEVVRTAFAALPAARVTVTEYAGDTPTAEIAMPHRIKAGIPGMYAERLSYWFGGGGGHVSFAPVLPIDGGLALEQVHALTERFHAADFDFCGAFTIGSRSMTLVTEVLYDKDDAEQLGRARALISALIDKLAAQGLGEYRGHLAFMDRIAQSFGWNDHALHRLHTTLKDALDPNGVLAPGKQGVWPSSATGRAA